MHTLYKGDLVKYQNTDAFLEELLNEGWELKKEEPAPKKAK